MHWQKIYMKVIYLPLATKSYFVENVLLVYQRALAC